MPPHRLAENAELRPLHPGHAEELFACVDAARHALTPWSLVAARVRDVPSARQLLHAYAHHHAHEAGYHCGIWLAGGLVGSAMIRALDPATSTCEVGAWLAPEARGQGLATHALTHLIAWAIHEHGMHHIELHSSPHNPHGAGLAHRLGMRRHRTRPDAVVINGTHHDSEIWAISATEWNHHPTHPASPATPRIHR